MMMYSFCLCGQGVEWGCCRSNGLVDVDDPIPSLVAWMCSFTSVHDVLEVSCSPSLSAKYAWSSSVVAVSMLGATLLCTLLVGGVVLTMVLVRSEALPKWL